jgi:hypothetical protein
MGYYAKIEPNNLVSQVIVAEYNFIQGLPGKWIETWMDGGHRKNYAGIGYTYNESLDAFIAPHPKTTNPMNDKEYVFDAETCRWVCTSPEENLPPGATE